MSGLWTTIRAGLGTPVRVANDIGIAELFGLLGQLRIPRLGKVEAHRDGNEGHLLAFEDVEIAGAARIDETVGAYAVLRCDHATKSRERADDKFRFHVFPPALLLAVIRF
jgi:hypothetical protein